MPYRDPEKQREAVKSASQRYRARKKVEFDKLTEEHEKAMKSIEEELAQKDRLSKENDRLKTENKWLKLALESAVKLFYKVHLMARDPSVPKSQIVNIPIPLGLIPLLNKMAEAKQLEV